MAVHGNHPGERASGTGTTRSIEIVYGPPGTGKTRYLLDQVEKLLHDGYRPDRIGYFSFTRAAAREAMERAQVALNLSKEDLNYFRTLHSAAYSLVNVKRNQVVNSSRLKKFSEETGHDFTVKAADGIEKVAQGTKRGDQLLYVYWLARAKCQDPVTTYYSLPEHLDFTERELIQFVKDFQDFKAYYGLLDFHDMLETCDVSLDLDVFIIDEAQDLSDLEWNFAKTLGKRAKQVVIAGDDDQAIYEWTGASVDRFLAFSGDKKVLPVSHRLPRNIYNAAQTVVNRITNRFPKEWQPAREDGEVERLPSFENVDISNGEWLLLARHQFQLTSYVQMARLQGRAYTVNGKSIINSEILRAVRAFESLRSGHKVSFYDAIVVWKYAIGGQHQVPNNEKIAWEDLFSQLDRKKTWMDVLKLSPDDQEYIRSLRRNGESLSNVPRVVISTIHGAKGLEADNVLLNTWASYRTRRAFERDPDAELRTWYVGVTRARKKLLIAGPEMFL